MPFGASVGVVSFFTTLGMAGKEEKKKKSFQTQFSSKAAPTRYQFGNGDSETLSGRDFHSNTREMELQKVHGTETVANNLSGGRETPAARG